jgi:hypothetical protein
MIYDIPGFAFAKSKPPSVITFDKPCRFDRVFENVLSGVCRTCWLDICGSRRLMTAKRSIFSGTR